MLLEYHKNTQQIFFLLRTSDVLKTNHNKNNIIVNHKIILANHSLYKSVALRGTAGLASFVHTDSWSRMEMRSGWKASND